MEATEPKLGISEKVYHAQVIINAFSKAMEDINCLKRVPIAIYSELEENEERLQEILDIVGEDRDPDIDRDYIFEYTDPEIQASPQVQRPLDEVEDSVKKRLLDSCFPCDTDTPSFDLGSVFRDIVARIEAFISDIKRLFDLSTPNFCHFTYLLSFLCVPDLVRILAIILARILQLTAALFLGSFALSAFIFGIIGAIFSAIMRFLISLISFALSPIYCVLQSLSEALNNLPTKNTLERRLTDDQYKLLYGTNRPEETSQNAAKNYEKALRGSFNNVSVDIADQLRSVKARVEDAAGGVQESFEQMIGLSQFLECEPKRSGVDILSKVQAVMELLQISNLIIVLIQKKGKRTAVDELCRIRGINDRASGLSPEDPLSVEDVADVIGTVLGGEPLVGEDDDGDITIVIKDPESPINNFITLFDCNLDEIIETNDIPTIIETILDPDPDILLDPDGEPPRTTVPVIPVSDPGYNPDPIRDKVYLFDGPIGDGRTILDVINSIDRDTTLLRGNSSESELRIIREQLEKLQDDTLPDLDSDNTLQIDPNRSTVNTLLNKSIQLKCGTIENIKNKLNNLEQL